MSGGEQSPEKTHTLRDLRDELVEAHKSHGRVFVGIGLARAVLGSRWLRSRLAQVWDDGFAAGQDYEGRRVSPEPADWPDVLPENPYRDVAEATGTTNGE